MIFSGRVQGVGFRWSACRAVSGVPVTGYVRNRVDGSVELVLEGLQGDTEAALKQVRRSLASYIEDVHESVGPATGEFPDFGIRR